MPGKTTCAKIKDPKKRARCEAYEGEYAAAKAKTPRRKPKALSPASKIRGQATRRRKPMTASKKKSMRASATRGGY